MPINIFSPYAGFGDVLSFSFPSFAIARLRKIIEKYIHASFPVWAGRVSCLHYIRNPYSLPPFRGIMYTRDSIYYYFVISVSLGQ